MEMTIYILGDMEFTYRILLGINMLYQSNVMHIAASILLILYVFWAYIKYILNPEHSPYPFREFAFGIIFYMIFGGLDVISPRFDVLLETDAYQGRAYEARVVPDIPFLAAAPAWLATNLFKGLRDTISPLLYVPGEHTGEQYPGMSSGLDPLALLTQLNGMSGDVDIDPYARKNIKTYINSCYLPFQQMGGSTDPTALSLEQTLNEPVDTFFQHLDVTVNWLFTKYYSPTNPEGIDTECHAAYQSLVVLLNGTFNSEVQSYLSLRDITADDIRIAHKTVVAAFTNPIYPDPYDFMVGKFAATYLNEALLESGVPIFVAMSNKMMFEASQKRVFDRAAESNMFIQIMVPAITAIEAFAFFIAPILMLLTVMGGVGITYIGKYLMLTLFINLWGFIKIFTDYFMLVTVKKGFGGDLTINPDIHPFSLMNQYHSFLEVENFIGIASSLTTAIPIFAMFLLYGGVHSMMGVMRSLGGGSADASNLAPTIATSGNAGVQQIADTSIQHIASTGHRAISHEVGTDARYGGMSITEGLSGAGQKQFALATTNLQSSQHSLSESVNELYQTAKAGGSSVTSTEKNSASINAGLEKSNNLAEASGVTASAGSDTNAQAMSRMAGSVALHLQAGVNSGKYTKNKGGEFSQEDIDDATRSVNKGIGASIGMDGSLYAAMQISESDSESFKQMVNKAATYAETNKSGEQYSEGFDWSKVDTKSTSAATSEAAAKVESNVEAVTQSRANVGSLAEFVSKTDGLTKNKNANWGIAAATFDSMDAKSAMSAFYSVFNGLSAKTQQAVLNQERFANVNDLALAYGGQNQHNSTRMLKSLSDDMLKRENYSQAAEVYSGISGHVGDHRGGFDAASRLASGLDVLDNYIDANAPKGPAMVGDHTPGTPPKFSDIQSKAEKGVEPAIVDRTGDTGNKFKGDDGKVKEQENNLGINLNNLTSKEIAKLEGVATEQQQGTNHIEKSAALKPGLAIITGIASGIQNVTDMFYGQPQAWGEFAETWAATTGSIAAKAGYGGEDLADGLLKIATFGAAEFAKLERGLQNGDTEAFQTLSNMNDAAVFLDRTDVGQQAFKALNEETRQGASHATQTTKEFVNGLGDNGKVTTDQMNAITTATLNGKITDANGDTMIQMATEPTGQGPLENYLASDGMKSTLFSAANGNISENPELLAMVTNSEANVATHKPGELVWNPDYKPVSNVVSELKNGPADNSYFHDFANAYSKDVISDTVSMASRANALQYDDNKFIQGVNMELLDNKELPSVMTKYFEAVTERNNDGGFMNYEAINDRIIKTALDANPFWDTEANTDINRTALDVSKGDSFFISADEVQQNANSLVYSTLSNSNIDWETRLKGAQGDAQLITGALSDLKGKAIDNHIAIAKEDVTGKPAERTEVNIDVPKSGN